MLFAKTLAFAAAFAGLVSAVPVQRRDESSEYTVSVGPQSIVTRVPDLHFSPEEAVASKPGQIRFRDNYGFDVVSASTESGESVTGVEESSSQWGDKTTVFSNVSSFVINEWLSEGSLYFRVSPKDHPEAFCIMYVDAAQGAENVVISTEFAYNADCGAEDLSRAPYTIEAVYKPSN